MTDSGKIKLRILPTGAMHADLTWLLVDPSRMATRDRPHRAREWVEVPTYVVYIEHPSGTKLLWDCGVPRDWAQRWRPTGFDQYFPVDTVTEDMWLDSRLRQLKVEPSDIGFLLLSHLHLDHAANANWWQGTGTRIIVDEEEKRGALSFDGYNRGGHIRPDYDQLPLDTINEDTEILPGVTLLRTPGHTWGTMSLKVDLADFGVIIFTSDSVYLKESYGPPPMRAGSVYDTIAWLKSVEKLRQIEQQTNATMIFGHSAAQLADLRHGPDEYYT